MRQPNLACKHAGYKARRRVERRRGAGRAFGGYGPAPHRVDSLPEQHIDSLPEPKRDEAYVQVGMICAFRSQGLSEDKVAYKAKFRSTNDMYFRLERWGLYGLLPLREGPQKVASEGEELPSAANAVPVGKRKAKKFGEKTPLPPAAGAVDQFRQTLEVLIKDLEKLREIG